MNTKSNINQKRQVNFWTTKGFHDRIRAFVAAANERSEYHKYTIGEVIVEAVKEYMDGREYLGDKGGKNGKILRDKT